MSRASLPLFAALLLLISGTREASAQASPPSYGADCPSQATAAADVLRDAKTYGPDSSNALHCYARAAARAAAEPDAATEAAARLGFATAAYSQSLYAAAGADAKTARAIFERLGDLRGVARAERLLGTVAGMSGDRAEARRLLTLAREAFTTLKMDQDLARVLLDLERVEDDRRSSLDLIEASLKISRAIGAIDLEGSALHQRADWKFADGKFDEAITDLNAAIERFSRQPETRIELSNAYVSLGRLLRAHGRPAEAIEYYDRAAAIQEEVGDLRGLAQSTNAKAIALDHLDRKAESNAAYERALEIAKRTGSPRIINFQRGNLAAALASSGKLEESSRLLEEVIAAETDPYILAYRYAALATNQGDLKRYEPAASNMAKAIELAKSSNNREFQVNLYYRFAIFNDALGRSDAALAAATEGIEVVEQIRSRLVPRDFLKRGFSDISQYIFGVTIALLHKQGDYERALVTSEQARARAFLDLLASRDAAPAAAPAGPVDKAVDPQGLVSDTAARTATAADISETVRRVGSTIVSYWVSDDETFIWVVSEGAPVRQTRVAIKSKTLEDLIAASLRPRDPKALTAFARLHTLLVDPVRQWLPARGAALTIIPYGALSRLSFAALRDARGVYLVERYAIGYAPSISTLLLTGARTHRASGTGYLLVADPTPMPVVQAPSEPASAGGTRGASSSLPPLPASRREVSGIRTVLGGGTVLAGSAARESVVRLRAADARVLHFATHGVVRNDEPFESFLAVGVEGDGAAGDGRLTVRELYDLRLSAELVVMSACRTATGPVSGDGIAGLSRAFFYAGTPTVVATLWDVADDPSAALMAAFYRNWRSGAGKDAALRRAQLGLIRQLRTGTVRVKTGGGAVIPLQEHPFYWAGYILIGER